MATKLNKSNTIIIDTRHEKKLTKLVSPFYHFPAKNYAINNIMDSKHKIEIKP